MIKKRVWLFWISSINTFFYPESFCKNAVSLWKCRRLKLRYYEKATKIWKISHLFWQNSGVSKQVGDFFKFLLPFQKKWTLTQQWLLYQLNSGFKIWVKWVRQFYPDWTRSGHGQYLGFLRDKIMESKTSPIILIFQFSWNLSHHIFFHLQYLRT